MSRVHRYILRDILSIFPSEPADSSYQASPTEDYQVRNRLIHFNRWFIRMRWVVCIIALALSILTVQLLEYLEKDAFWPLIATIMCLAASNILYVLFLRLGRFVRVLMDIQMFSDLAILTAMLHFSGGIENPLFFAYLFHIVIGSIFLDRRKCYIMVVVACVLFSALIFSEMGGILRHYTPHVFPHIERGERLLHAAHEPAYVISLVSLQIVFMSLTVYFTTSIMERLRFEENRALAERQRLERVVEATGTGLAIFDKDLRLVWLNERIRIWLDLSDVEAEPEPTARKEGIGDDMVGHSAAHFQEWFGGRDGPAAKTLEDGMVRVVEREFIDAQGSKRYFQVTVAPLMDNTEHVYQVVELTQDITQRKIIEAEMLHSEKMAVLGSMAAGIAHEIGNPLASISTRLRLLEEKHDKTSLKEGPNAPSCFRLLQSQIARIGRIVHGISQFARPAKEGWTVCQVNRIVAEIFDVLRLHPVAKNCQIYTELAEELPNTTGVKDQMTQVFLNLGLNALEAMPDGGDLTIKTYTGGGEIRIEFADTGVGINREIRSKIFDAFFTTKDNGLGLGLYNIRNITHAHDGRIEVESSPGEGSLFTVILPIRTLRELPH